MEHTAIELLLGGVVIFVAYLVRGITGFGSGLIAIPLLALIYPLQTVVPLIVLLDLIGSGAQAISSRKHADWRILLPLLPATLVGIALALYFFQHIDTSTLSLSLGVFVMVFAVYQLLPTPDLEGSSIMAAPLGLLGGLMGFLFGTGGPFYVVYFDLLKLEKKSFRANYSFYFLLDGLFRMVVYILGLSLLKAEWIGLLLLASVPFVAGLYTGRRVHHEIEPIVFKRLISLVLLASGTALIYTN